MPLKTSPIFSCFSSATRDGLESSGAAPKAKEANTHYSPIIMRRRHRELAHAHYRYEGVLQLETCVFTNLLFSFLLADAMTDKIPHEKQNGSHSHSLPASAVGRKTRCEASTSTASVVVSNGTTASSQASVVRVVCPEMCCFCFDVLISHVTNNHHSNRSPFVKYFKNDE